MKIIYFKLSLILLISVILTSCGTYTTIRHKSNYEDSLNKVGQILVLPPNVEVHMSGTFSYKERMYEYEYHLEDLIYKQIKNSLEGKNYRAKIFRKRDIKNLDLSESFHKFRMKYNVTRDELYKPLTMPIEKAYNIEKNLGSEAKIIGEVTDSRFLIIIDYSKSVKTTGARTLDLAASLFLGSHDGAGEADKGVIFVAIIDAITGNLLWSNFSVHIKDVYSSTFENLSDHNKVDIENLREIINIVLKPLKNKN